MIRPLILRRRCNRSITHAHYSCISDRATAQQRRLIVISAVMSLLDCTLYFSGVHFIWLLLRYAIISTINTSPAGHIQIQCNIVMYGWRTETIWLEWMAIAGPDVGSFQSYGQNEKFRQTSFHAWSSSPDVKQTFILLPRVIPFRHERKPSAWCAGSRTRWN